MTLLFLAVIHDKVFNGNQLLKLQFESPLGLQTEFVNHSSGFVDVNQISKINPKKYWRTTDFEKKDWHDYEFMKYEASRTGPGEKGEGFNLTDPADIKLNAELLKIEGLYAIVSDKISVNRSVPDVRHEK
jgi:hypothetical protein